MTIAPPSAPCCCDTDPIEGLKQLFVDYAQGRTILAGRDPATRPVFLRLHGVAHGHFEVDPNLPDDLRIGLFAQPATYPTWVRFSSDVQPGNPDLKGTLGIGIKLFGVEGQKVLDPDATTHDFILQNHDVFFADTAYDMCAFTCESLNGRRDEYLCAHPITAQILTDMKKDVDSPLITPYWSGLPFAFGSRFVKYKLEPIEVPPGDTPDYDDPTYLRADLHARLARGEARFRFSIQLQTDPQTMPLDAATVRWCEADSPPIPVATLVLPKQDLGTRGQDTYGENLSYNTWRALEVHRPVGSIADARRVVYQASAANRRNVNGVPEGEPAVPRPPQYTPQTDYPAAKDTRVIRAAIHPAIGIARVGNSDEFFVGPQVSDPAPRPVGFYRDAQGALKREACEFRIYGYNADHDVVTELTANTADISWSVHVANRKAEWFQWKIALDIPEAKDESLVRRNRNFGKQDFDSPTSHIRSALVIDPGTQSIHGRNANPAPCVGHFMGVEVSLGELRTDDAGRLLFLGGHGVSASPTGDPILPPNDPNAFINADGWYDDICDGIVEAHVTIDGRTIPVETAWVLTAPPNYAPQVKGERTLYDLLYDLYVQAGWLPTPGKPSFTRDVYPILARLSGLQWVNQGFATLFGYGGQFDFNAPDFLQRLSQNPTNGFDPHADLRRQIFNSFRPPAPTDGNQMPWPWLYGDAMEVIAADNPRQNAAITVTQYRVLSRWAKGDFSDDWKGPPPPTSIDAVPLAEQPATLDRAALDFALADAFHPGCEVTWPIRHLTMYRSPFRIRRRAPDDVPREGSKLTTKQALAPDGPLYGQRPGDLTRWMGLPWQADTAFCRAGYDTSYDPFVPTFWPARVPNQVLSEADYRLVINENLSKPQRIQAFVDRTNWNEPLSGNTAAQMEQMVRIFGSMGLVEVRPGIPDSDDFPATMMVASFGPDAHLKPRPSPIDSQGDTRLFAEGPDATEPEAPHTLPRGANFRSLEEALGAPQPVTKPTR